MQSTGAWRYHRFCSNIGVLIVHLFVCLPEMCGAAAAYSWLELFFLFLGWLSPWARGCSLSLSGWEVRPQLCPHFPPRERERAAPGQGRKPAQKEEKKEKKEKTCKNTCKKRKKTNGPKNGRGKKGKKENIKKTPSHPASRQADRQTGRQAASQAARQTCSHQAAS